jgi:hypothetical protein
MQSKYTAETPEERQKRKQEIRRAAQKKYAERHPDRVHASHAKSDAKHAEQKRAYRRTHFAEIYARVRKWQLEHLDQVKASKQKYADAHLEQSRAYCAAHKEETRNRSARWLQEHREENRDHARQYRQEHPGECRAIVAAWLKDHPNAQSVYSRNRRARNAAAEGSSTIADIQTLWIKQNKCCAVPKCKYPISEHGKHKYHVDHIRALINGGSNWPANLQILCSTHNQQKHAADDIEWAQRMLGTLFVL